MGEAVKPAGHAFICYARADSIHADQLHRALEEADVPVWRDTADLWPGEDWRVKIRQAITGGALVFIACFSRASLAREKSFQYEELLLAIEELRTRRPDVPWLIPVRFDDCQIPERDIGGGRTLASLHRADLFGERSEEGLSRLVTTVLRILGQSQGTDRSHDDRQERVIGQLGSGGLSVPFDTNIAGPARSKDRATSSAGRSAITAFYGDLDPARFLRDAEVLGAPGAAATASGSVMLGLLIGGSVPLLSHNQAFDNRMILQLVSDVQDKAARDDRLAFLQLARDGHVKVGLLDPVLIDDPPDGQKHTLLNAFRSALARPATFFSGWPELNGELKDARPDILDRLDHAPDQMEELSGPEVAARIEGLRILSANLRQGQEQGLGSILVIRPSPHQQSLEARLRNDLQSDRPVRSDIGTVASWIFDNAGRLGTNLSLQSEWITWANRYLSEHGGAAERGVFALKDLVNAHFIQIQAESYGAHGLSLACRDAEAERLLADDMGLSAESGKRLSELVLDASQGGWLRWAQLPELLAGMALLTTGDAPTTAEARLRHLEADHRDWVGRYATDHNVGASVRLAVPQSLAVAGSTAEAMIAGASPIQATGVAAVGAVVTLAAATPAVRRREQRDRRRVEEHEGERWQKEFRTGSAAWPSRIAWHIRSR